MPLLMDPQNEVGVPFSEDSFIVATSDAQSNYGETPQMQSAFGGFAAFEQIQAEIMEDEKSFEKKIVKEAKKEEKDKVEENQINSGMSEMHHDDMFKDIKSGLDMLLDSDDEEAIYMQ